MIYLLTVLVIILAVTIRKPAKKYKDGRVTKYNAFTDKW
ncbi:MAG: hypothetical protein JWO92_2498 [Chitinophagaceae bacterium]|nr:hypothetical protein [Chitinophagaceae bacterium]